MKKFKKDYTVDQLISKYKCKNFSSSLIALTPIVLDSLDDSCELVDFYGHKKTKGEFLKARNGKLYPSATGGVTIFCLEYAD